LVTEKFRTDTITAVLKKHARVLVVLLRRRAANYPNRIHKTSCITSWGSVSSDIWCLGAPCKARPIYRGKRRAQVWLYVLVVSGSMHCCAESNNMGRVGGVANAAQMPSGVSILPVGGVRRRPQCDFVPSSCSSPMRGGLFECAECGRKGEWLRLRLVSTSY
jgi:hypothetical protein